MRGRRGWPREDRGSPPAPSDDAASYQAAAGAIEDQFRRQLAGLRRRFQAWEIPAVVRAIQDQRYLALRLLRERRAAALFAARQERRRRQPPPQPSP